MPRIADELERESRTVDLEQGDFERLLGRRERNQRHRRMRAGALGVIVALAMALVLVRSLPSDRVPADPPVEPRPAPAAVGTLAYILDGAVYVADPDGSNPVKIAKGISLDDCASIEGFSFWAEGAMWSPDGRYLAYRRTPCPYTEEDWGDVVIADAAGNVLAMFPADGWDIGWSPDSTRVAVWDTLFETVGVYGVDGGRQTQITMPAGWGPSGDHDPAWLRDGTLAIDAVELPLDGRPAKSLDQARAAEWQEDYAVAIGARAVSPDGSRTASIHGRSLSVEGSDGSGSLTLLTVERGTSLSVIGFSPEGNRILFSKDRQGGRSLWSIGVDGSDARPVVAGTTQGDWFSPSLTSNDIPADPSSVEPTPTPAAPTEAGEVLSPMSGIGTFPRGSTDLVAQDPDGGQVRTIVDAKALPGGCSQECSFGSSEAITGAAWSHDRAWVAFRAGGLWVADTVGGDPQQLTADQGWFPWAWSPTDDRLAVVQGKDVTLVNAATGGQTDLGTVAGPEDSEGYAVHNLVWSPDGTRIAYDGGPGWGSVYSIDAESGEHALLVLQPAGTGEITDIDWSPDGEHLAISYVDEAYIESHRAELGSIWYKATALYLAKADGSDLRRLDRTVASEWGVWHPGTSVGTAWSPDGTRLAYTSFSGPDHQELQVWTVSVDGSAPSLIASHCCVSDGGSPVWTPDGSQIAFDAEPPGDLPHDHLIVNADGTGGPAEIDELTYLSWLDGWYFCHCYG